MARPHSSNPKKVSITVKMSQRDLEVLDQNRKGVSRSTYLRIMGTTPPEPRPVHDPVQPPVPDPIVPPIPPPKPVETVSTPVKHYHRFKKADQAVDYIQGRPRYRQVCTCGETKVDF